MQATAVMAGVTITLALLAPGAMAGDGAVSEALGRTIIGPHQTLAEVQDFVETRIPPMPEVATADEWTALADHLRAEVLSRVVFRGNAPLWRDAPAGVAWLGTIEGGPGYRIRKLRYEAIPGLWVPALLYEPTELRDRMPVVLNVNGHDPQGKAADYKQIRCINQARRGMLALNVEWFGMGQLRSEGFAHGLINSIDLCGTSGIACHYLSLKRGLDVLLSHEHADPSRVAVTGLSGGGWQTIFISPLDPRVTFTDPVAGYSGFHTRVRHVTDLGDSEQTPCDLATVVDYTHLTAMMAPHPTLLTFNAKDNCCFAAPHALPPLREAAAPIFRLYGKEANLRTHVNEEPGDHNYGLDNRQALYRMLVDHGFSAIPGDDAQEIPSQEEVKSADRLAVDLPGDNATFQRVALDLARELPHEPGLPENREEARRWQTTSRPTLRAIVRPYDLVATAAQVESDEKDGLRVTTWRVRVGASWSVPAVELSRGEPSGTAILMADEGRSAADDETEALLARGLRVVAIDPYAFGEAQVEHHAYLFALMVGTVGERPLGVQAGQVMAVARWLRERDGSGPVSLMAVGPRTSTIALVASALEPEAIGSVELSRPLGSLKELIEAGKPFDQAPELFCFGLLEAFDVRQIAALVAPRPVRLVEADERAKAELGSLGPWSRRLEPMP